MVEETVYVHKIGELLDDLVETPRSELVQSDFCASYYPYDALWFIYKHEFLWCNLDFGRRVRVKKCPFRGTA